LAPEQLDWQLTPADPSFVRRREFVELDDRLELMRRRFENLANAP
jgi:hypothetical protein